MVDGVRWPRSTSVPAASAPPADSSCSRAASSTSRCYIDVSNVQLVCKCCGKPTRIGHRIEGDTEDPHLPQVRGGALMAETYVPRLKQKLPARVRGPSEGRDRAWPTSCRCRALDKIVVNMGVGDAVKDGRMLDAAVADLTIITGQKPVVTKARKSIAGFKLREGMPIGAKVTLRGNRMWEFYDRLVTLALPRIRDFRGHGPERVRRPRQLHGGRHRAADLPGDRLRQGR